MNHKEVQEILRETCNSEALGMDGLLSGALRYAPSRLASWFCPFINPRICHQQMSSKVLAVKMISLLKSKCETVQSVRVCGEDPELLGNFPFIGNI